MRDYTLPTIAKKIYTIASIASLAQINTKKKKIRAHIENKTNSFICKGFIL